MNDDEVERWEILYDQVLAKRQFLSGPYRSSSRVVANLLSNNLSGRRSSEKVHRALCHNAGDRL